jgi:hypothetical protein
MIRTCVLMTPALLEKVKAAAKRRGVSFSDLVRKSVESQIDGGGDAGTIFDPKFKGFDAREPLAADPDDDLYPRPKRGRRKRRV